MNDQPTDYSSLDMTHIGRRRKPNFTDHEVLYIIDRYDENKELLHSREASKSIIAQKQAVWKRITDDLNTEYPQVERTVEDVRRKWKKLQSEAKREIANYRTAQAAGSTTSLSQKQLTLYNRILAICRGPPTTNSQNSHHMPLSILHHTQILQRHPNMNNHDKHDISYNDQLSDKADSPVSDNLPNVVPGQIDSPGDESTSLIGNDDNSPHSATNYHIVANIPSHTHHQLKQTSINGQVSKRTLDKRRKQLKPSVNQYMVSNSAKISAQTQPLSTQQQLQQQNSLRYESLIKRKRLLQLKSQQLACQKEMILLERKHLETKLATIECENERINIEKRRTEIAIQRAQCHLSLSTNGNNHLSDQDDHDDNNSLDDISDLNE